MKILLRCSLAAFVAPHVGCFDPDGSPRDTDSSAETTATSTTGEQPSTSTTTGDIDLGTSEGEETVAEAGSSSSRSGSSGRIPESSADAGSDESGSQTGEVIAASSDETDGDAIDIMCEDGSYLPSPEATRCLPWSSCGWAEMLAEGTPTSDVECDPAEVVQQFGTEANEFVYALAVDHEGSVYAAVETGDETAVRKIRPDGGLAWARTIPSTDVTYGRGIAVDSTGAVVIAGWTSGAVEGTHADDYDAYVCKYDAEGALLWCRQFGSAGWEEARSVATDSTGNVVVVGQTSGADYDENDAFVRVYSPDGELRWNRQFGVPAGADEATDVAIDGEDNIFVAGATNDDLGGTILDGDGNVFVRKFSLAGDVLWSRQFGSGRVHARIAVTPEGRVFTSASQPDAVPPSRRFHIIALASDGGLDWIEPFGGSNNETLVALAIDATGRVLGAGGAGSGSDSDAYIAGFTAEGVPAFERTLGSDDEEWAAAITVSERGPIYLAGRTPASWGAMNAGEFDAFIVQLHPPVVSD